MMTNFENSISQPDVRERIGARPVTRPRILSKVAAARGGFTEFALVFVSALAVFTALALRTTYLTYSNPDFRQPWDHHKYIRMAQGNPFDFHIAPYCWRVVTPLLAKVLPFSLEWNFFFISFLSILMTGVVVYYMARALEFSRELAFVGMLLFFALGYSTKTMLSDFWLTDPLSTFVMSLAILCILTRKDVLFVLLLFLGEGVRETVISVAPLYYTLNARRMIDPRLAVRTVIYALPAVAVFFGLRIFIPEMNNKVSYLHTLTTNLRIQSGGQSSYSEKGIVQSMLRRPLYHIRLTLPAVTNLVRNSMVLLPFLLYTRTRMLALRFAPYALVLYAPTLALGPVARYLIPLYPVLALLSVSGVEFLSQRLRIPVLYFAGLPLLFIGSNLLSVNARDASGVLQTICLFLYLTVLVVVAVQRGGLSRLRAVSPV
jgi:hypothetical protein